MTNATSGTGPAIQDRPSPAGFFLGFVQKFTVLRNAPPELWLVFGIKLLTYAAYQVSNMGLKLWLTADFGYGDQKALALVAAWAIAITVFTLLVGPLTDALGLRKTFFLGVWVCIVARAVMTFVTIPWLAIAGGLFPLALGEALGTPVLVAAVRQYSSARQRSISFSIFYMVMNVGFVVAGCLLDFVRQGLGEHGALHLPGCQISTYRCLFLVALVIEFIQLPLIYFLRPGLEMTDEGPKFAPVAIRRVAATLWGSCWGTVRDSVRDTIRLFAELVRQEGFHRLLGFLMLIAFLKLIFMQMYYVYPTFGIRELGAGAPVGTLWAINGLLIIFLVPVVGALTQRFSAYNMVIVGGVISALSVFIMALPTAGFEPLANGWLGRAVGHWYLGLKGTVHPYYVMIFLFVVLLSIGEAFYSPRVYEYAAAIAPKGREASYGALSYVPFLLAKLLIGVFSGTLLAKYCPEQGVRHSGTMWLMVALTATIAPLGLILFRRYIRVKEADRND